MANELTLNVNIAYAKGSASHQQSSSNQVTVNGTKINRQIVSVGTSDEALSLGDVGTIGYVYLRNLDSTNYVEVGQGSADYALKLKAGEFALFRYNDAALHAKANTGACLLEFLIIED